MAVVVVSCWYAGYVVFVIIVVVISQLFELGSLLRFNSTLLAFVRNLLNNCAPSCEANYFVFILFHFFIFFFYFFVFLAYSSTQTA